MNIAVRAAPPPGSAQAGDLYVDLQSRTLWLGVDPVVDPAAFVLISDIVALQAEIATGDNAVTAYVDQQITTRAPTVHTHTSAQITDFTGAVTTVVGAMPALSFVHGMIMMWSGSLAEIGVGSLAGWTLCDGSNGSPDLRERFVLAAGTRAVGAKNASNSMDTAIAGGHNHLLGATAITIEQLPSHDHTPGTGGESVDHAHYFNANTGTESADHSHGTLFSNIGTGQGRGPGADTADPSYGDYKQNYQSGGRSAAHYHNVQAWTGGRNAGHTHGVYAQGGGQGHTHSTAGDGVHSHNITGALLREGVPFYALAFIMKL